MKEYNIIHYIIIISNIKVIHTANMTYLNNIFMAKIINRKIRVTQNNNTIVDDVEKFSQIFERQKYYTNR